MSTTSKAVDFQKKNDSDSAGAIMFYRIPTAS